MIYFICHSIDSFKFKLVVFQNVACDVFSAELKLYIDIIKKFNVENYKNQVNTLFIITKQRILQ